MQHRYQRILLVDRDRDFQIGLADALRREDVVVLSVNGCDLALQVIEDGYRPDAIVVDLALRDISSAELLRYASSHAVPAVAISPGPATWKIGPTADRELHEPFDIRELLAVLDQLCSSPRSPADRGR
jgi:DNA-binding response OmpR family regulator